MKEVIDVFRGRKKMGRWRGKFLFALIIYAAGFFTAIYVLAPEKVQAAGKKVKVGWNQKTNEQADAESPAWMASVKEGMSRARSFAEEKAGLIADKVRERMTHGINEEE